MTTDRETLYQQAIETYRDRIENGFTAVVALRAVVDLVLDAQADRPDDADLAQLVRDVRDGQSHSVTIDRVLIAPCDSYGRVDSYHAQDRPDFEVLREAAKVYRGFGYAPDIRNAEMLEGTADALEAEHRAAQEKAEREAAREKLIEQAARILFHSDDSDLEWEDPALGKMRDEYRTNARALADAGFLTTPETTDGGAA